MKSFLLSAILASFFFSFASAQGFGVGVKVGTNINKIQGQSFKDQFTYGYSAGVYADIKVSNKWSIQPEVLFNQVSSTLDSNYKSVYKDVFFSDQSKVRLGYLSIPILLDYKLLGNFLMLQAGPQVGILINKNEGLVKNGVDAFSHGDFSMVGGVQLKLSSIRVTGRYVVGLSNINDLDNSDKWKNQGFQVSLGLAL